MFSLTQGLRRARQIRPNEPATAFAGRRHSWGQTADRVARAAGALSALGVQRGDRVAILTLNSDRYFELMYAIPWIGAVMVPLNTRLASPEIEHVLNDSGTVALFVDAAMARHLTALDGKLPDIREVVWLDDIAAPEGMLRYEDLAANDPLDDAGACDDDLAGLSYAGGTTGRSQGVMLTHTNLVVNAMNAVAGMGFSADTAYIHSGAMFHLADGASTFGVSLAGGRHASVSRFEPVDVLQTIAAAKVTHAQFVPTMIDMPVNHPRFGELMKGYWNKPAETDRLKDMIIISGGENVYSAEVENAISLMPGVGEVAVIGVPDERRGERVHAIVVPREGITLTADDVRAHCRPQIAGYKCPRSADFRDTPLPLSGAGKVLKRELRESYWKGFTKLVN